MNRETYQRIFEVWCKKLRLSPDWDVRLEWSRTRIGTRQATLRWTVRIRRQF